MVRIGKIVDLSMLLTEATPVYPGDPVPSIRPAATFAKEGYHVEHLQFGSHFGTHVDAPFHFFPEGRRIDELDLSLFIGTGVLIDVTGKTEREGIGLPDVEPYLERLGPGKIALIHTGWSKYAGEEKYFRHPYVKEEAVDEMLRRGVRTFFIDALNIDATGGSAYPAHEKILGANGVIGENFVNFEQIDFPDPLIVAFPLKIAGSDGSPVRALAIDLEKSL
ncbi:cyclase family protein [Bacillaceae bacterium]